jgi:hypothetical protein
MDSPQKEKALNKVMKLMEEIQEEEKGLHQVVQNKRIKLELVDTFLSAGTTHITGNAEDVLLTPCSIPF